MGFSTVFSRAVYGMRAIEVHVEVHLSAGLPRFAIVGLPETVVKESKDRVRSAILMSHFKFSGRRLTVNLAPADVPKEGGRFDLAIAMGILLASHQLPKTTENRYEFIGELALSGELRPISSCLPIAIAAAASQRALILPQANAEEAALVEGLMIYPAQTLLQVCQHITGQQLLPVYQKPAETVTIRYPDLADVKGQAYAKYALEIAAAGGHSLLMTGTPGSGKSMLATRLPGILPPLQPDQAYETAVVGSMMQKLDPKRWLQRPFRSPHHGASAVALVGGGNPPKPGEISLAHHGILFLDELPEFQRQALEMLREPMESGHIMISRAGHQMMFPANFQLIAAMNPCPCGYLGDKLVECRCNPSQISRYQSKLSGPLLDRIDLHLTVPRLSLTDMTQNQASEHSDAVRSRVILCHRAQLSRQQKLNSRLTAAEVNRYCQLDEKTKAAFLLLLEKLQVSVRVYHKALKVARTVADLQAKTDIELVDLQQALQFRVL